MQLGTTVQSELQRLSCLLKGGCAILLQQSELIERWHEGNEALARGNTQLGGRRVEHQRPFDEPATATGHHVVQPDASVRERQRRTRDGRREYSPTILQNEDAQHDRGLWVLFQLYRADERSCQRGGEALFIGRPTLNWPSPFPLCEAGEAQRAFELTALQIVLPFCLLRTED